MCYTAIVNKKLDDTPQPGAPGAESGMGGEDHVKDGTPGHKHLRRQLLTVWRGWLAAAVRRKCESVSTS
ncbi:protein of unknown function [Enterobacter cancerogenus]|nr:protein of unknown function [Enterobacter cancerogenus]